MAAIDNYLESVYDTADIKDTKDFEKFLSTRLPPELPEKLDNSAGNSAKQQPGKSVNSSGKSVKSSELSQKDMDEIMQKQSVEAMKKAEEIAKNDDYRLDVSYVLRNEKFFRNFFNYSLNVDADLNITQILNDWTNFSYNPYGELRSNYIRNVGERLVIISDLGKLFNYDFITKNANKSYRFDCLNFEICRFIGNLPANDKEVTSFEHRFIKNMLGKLLICLLSNVERSFAKQHVQINIIFKKAVSGYLKEFSYLLKDNNRVTYSWTIFEKLLFMSAFDSDVYYFNGAEDIKQRLTEAYNDKDGFIMEQLIANTLKCYIPTVAYSYFITIKNIYLLARLISVYVNRKLYVGKDRNIIMNDFYTIAAAITTEYEVNYLSNINVRCSPSCKHEDLSKQTELYYINHLIAGPQYFLLKQLELSLPTLYITFNNAATAV